MRHFDRLSRFWNDEDGTASVEYVVVLGLIVVAIIAVASFGRGVLDVWRHNGDKLEPVLD
jgi:Flp pilus assembly pilin Flp